MFDRKMYCFDQVLITALWAECDFNEDGDIPLDRDYSIADFSEYAINDIAARYERFIEQALTILPPDFVPNWENMAHDFWLTCKGYGAGFWDRPELEYGNLGKQLTDVCGFIDVGHLYVGDDGKIHRI